jgi:hypothetical protein
MCMPSWCYSQKHHLYATQITEQRNPALAPAVIGMAHLLCP